MRAELLRYLGSAAVLLAVASTARAEGPAARADASPRAARAGRTFILADNEARGTRGAKDGAGSGAGAGVCRCDPGSAGGQAKAKAKDGRDDFYRSEWLRQVWGGI